ncbi:disrupter of telomere silencing protein Dot5 [Histoplasma capsulatum]|uniref:thioredoxin-dependent peroxiredoxin n=1 Tax=Ajellomyces capsulatus TaxID=5037 RepID=A0A8A1MBC8_AJECA|nr:disrupter of telomere silencing protein Dot5 [Histoplasma capsulatum]
MVELRKRKAPAEPPKPSTKKTKKVTKPDAPAAVAAIPRPKKEEALNAEATPVAPSSQKKPPKIGDTIDLDQIGTNITTHDGAPTTLKSLVEQSASGVVLFTYPRASTPGCTTQVCLFRDRYDKLTSTGLSIFGLSADSPKANANFKSKQNLPYPLLCDPTASLIGALGLKKTPKGTVRGVFAVSKEGKVLLLESGGPAATADTVQKLVESG